MKFAYRARDDLGRQQQGVIQASSEEAALQALDRQGFYVTALRLIKERSLYAKDISFFDRITAKDVMLFSRQLSIMFKSHVSLVDALSTIGLQTKSKGLKERVFRISQDVEAGTLFSEALEKHPEAFSAFYTNMIKRGEKVGNLSEVLQYLADHLEREHEVKSKVKGAMIYPIFVVVIAFAVLTLLSILVLPNLTKLLEDSGSDLPAVTKVVIGFSNFYRQWWWLITIAMGVAVGIVLRLSKTKRGRGVVHRWSLKIPAFGSFLRMMYVVRFGESLSTLVSGGVAIVEALSITGRVLGNEVYERIVGEAKDSVAQGNRVADTFERYPKEFPPVFTQMIKVGEKSGALAQTLKEIVRFYRGEMNRSIDTFLGLIEPTLIVVLGLLVGGLMAALMLPLYQGLSGGIQ